MKDWEIIVTEYKKSELLKNKDLSNLTWFLNKEDWYEFIEYCKRVTPFDPSQANTITFMGVEFRMYKID